MNHKLPIVGIMGSGSVPHTQKASQVGVWLAKLGVHLLTGGGPGVMESASKAFHNTANRKGLVIGIIPGNYTESGYSSLPGYPNPWVEIPIYTHLPLSGMQGKNPMSRNHINILSSDVIIALPGSSGTASEVRLSQQYDKPLIAFLENPNEISDLPTDTLIDSSFAAIQEFVLSHIGAGLKNNG